MKTLDELALLHNTDKASNAHDYMRFYEEIVGGLRNEPIRILEFGVKTGASIAMWEDAFPHAHVVGVDNNLRKLIYKPKRALLFSADASNRGDVEKLCEGHGPFDLVVDDSAHTERVAQTIVDAVWPKWIKPGGWLVIEDVNSGYKRDLRPDQKHDFVGWASRMVLSVNHHGNLCKCGPGWWDRSTEFDKAIERIVYVPGIMAMRRRP